MAIEAIANGVAPATAAQTSGAAGRPNPVSSVGDSFARLIDVANTSDAGANQAVGRMLEGTGDVHEAMIALQQADLALQFTVQVRNKIVQAYQDIMRMPV